MPELPTGTVTFLFTDIEGSTRLEDLRIPALARPADDVEAQRGWDAGVAMTLEDAVRYGLDLAAELSKEG